MNSAICDRRLIPVGMSLRTWTAPDGWKLRQFDWPAAEEARGSLLFLNGRGDFIEKYLEAAQHWHVRGWHVRGFDWRGQGGSGRLNEGAEGYESLLDRLLDDAVAYVRDWSAAMPRPHVIVGHSMGGHLLLRLLAERGVTPDAAVLVAPMLGLNSAPIPESLARAVTRTLCRLGWAGRPVWDEQAGHAHDRQRRLTACQERFADACWWKSQQPALRLGAPCWGWLAAAYDSIAKLRAPGVLEAMRTPCLIVAAKGDQMVSGAAIESMAARLPDVRLTMFPTPGHELLREADATRIPAFAAIDLFLDERAPRG